MARPLCMGNGVPRRKLIKTSDFPYYVRTRSNHKEWFYIPPPLCWMIFAEQTRVTSRLYGVLFHCGVLISDQLHLILTTRLANLGDVMRHFETGMAKAIQKQCGRINHIFGARYTWSALNSSRSVAYAYKYLHRMPVCAGVTERVEEYPFSTIYQNLEVFPAFVEGIDSSWSLVPKKSVERLKWLNEPAPIQYEDLIRKGLRKDYFRFSTHSNEQAHLRSLRRTYGVEHGLT